MNASVPPLEDGAAVVPPYARPLAGPWTLVLTVGGTCWALATLSAIAWTRPFSGQSMQGIYWLTSGGRAAQHLLMFLCVAPAYRVALALGWPAATRARLVVVAGHALLLVAIIRLSPFALGLASAWIDDRPQDLADLWQRWQPFAPGWDTWRNGALFFCLFFLMPYALGLCALALVVASRAREQASQRAAALSRAYGESRLALVSAQLQPHFLFNALHAVSELIDESPVRARRMIARIGDFLRHAIDGTRQPWTPLAAELDGVRTYLAIQQVRFEDRLQCRVESTPAANAVRVPTLLLQPLVENAIEHARPAGGGTIHVAVRADVVGDRLTVAVTNDGPGLAHALPVAEYGDGLRNVAARLASAYAAAEATLSVGPGADGAGTVATVVLPRRTGAPST
jgi:signal transduction histidine kinase